MSLKELVSVVDDDESIRESLPDLLEEMGYAARTFASAEEYLNSGCVDQTACLILDIAMPGMSGPDLHRVLVDAGHRMPVIYITANADEAIRPRMLALGATDCLSKPFTDRALQDALDAALQSDTPPP